jgi:exonuclease VII large subunit
MSQYAKVNSVVMLKEWRSALATFSQTAAIALDELSSEIQRTLTWLAEDRRRYWKTQVRLRQERYVQAKLALKRKGLFDLALAGVRGSALDEKKAFAIAERRLREAERRLARTQSWVLRIEKELSDYRAATQGLSGAIDLDIPNARARLEKMAESLEAYVALAPPEAVRDADEEMPDNLVPPEVAPSAMQRPLPTSAEADGDISEDEAPDEPQENAT